MKLYHLLLKLKKKAWNLMYQYNVAIQVVCIIYTCVLYFLRRRWWEGPWWGGISSTEQTARSGSPQLFYTESRTGNIPMSTKTNAINIIMKKTQKLPCFGYNMLCNWIEDNICFLLGPLSNAYEGSKSRVSFKRDCSWTL